MICSPCNSSFHKREDLEATVSTYFHVNASYEVVCKLNLETHVPYYTRAWLDKKILDRKLDYKTAELGNYQHG